MGVIKQNDTLIAMRSEDHQVIAYKLGTPTNEGELAVAVITTTGAIAMKVTSMTQQDEIGLPVKGCDDVTVAVKGDSKCEPEVLGRKTTNSSSPEWDLTEFLGAGQAPPGARWRLIEVGSCLLYGSGDVDGHGTLVGLPDKFVSHYSYNGYMELQIACYMEDEYGELRWVWPGNCS